MITCAHCRRGYHHRCLGWPDEDGNLAGLEFRCETCRQEQAKCAQVTCTGRGIHRIKCDDCSRPYHFRCLGWADEARDTTGLIFRCNQCKLQVSTSQRPSSRSFHNDSTYIPAQALETLLPDFAGKPHESPSEFIELTEEVLAGAQLPERVWHQAAGKHLRGEAAHWWAKSRDFITSWSEFRQGLTDTFNHPDVLSQLKIKLFSSIQRQDEPAEAFIRSKIQLYNRIVPEAPDSERIQAILATLKPDLRFYLSRPRPNSVEDMLEGARTFEVHAGQSQKIKTPKTQIANNAPTNPTNTPTSNTETPAWRQRPRKCWYCPGQKSRAI